MVAADQGCQGQGWRDWGQDSRQEGYARQVGLCKCSAAALGKKEKENNETQLQAARMRLEELKKQGADIEVEYKSALAEMESATDARRLARAGQ